MLLEKFTGQHCSDFKTSDDLCAAREADRARAPVSASKPSDRPTLCFPVQPSADPTTPMRCTASQALHNAAFGTSEWLVIPGAVFTSMR